MQKALQIGGLIAGAATANPGLGAAISGAGTGAALGGTLGGLLGSRDSGSTAVERRMGGAPSVQAPPAEDPQKVLQESMLALQSQPKDVQAQYAPQLQAAMLKLNRGMA